MAQGTTLSSGNCLYSVLNITVVICLCVYVQMCFYQCMCVRVEGSVSVLCIFIMWPVTEYGVCVVVYASEHTYVTVVCLRLCICVRWGQLNVTTSWCGTALLLTREVVVSQSQLLKPMAMLLVL